MEIQCDIGGVIDILYLLYYDRLNVSCLKILSAYERSQISFVHRCAHAHKSIDQIAASYYIALRNNKKKNRLFIMTPAIIKKVLSGILREGCLIHQLHSSTSTASVSFISLKPNTLLVYVHHAKV